MVSRRTFVTQSALAAGAAALGRSAPAQVPPATAPIGIQVGAVSFVDEGTEKVLDVLGEMAGVNTLFVATFTYGRGIAGRQPRGSALPDHGKQEYDDNYRGGNFATPHPELYKKTSIAPEKAPDHPGYDVLADVIPAAHRRRMKVIAWFEDVFRADVPGLDKALEVDVHGKAGTRLCLRNPNTREFWLALVEDHLRFNPGLDGLMWGSERQGPLNDALGASHGAGARPSTAACFCPHCLEAARREGINADRARQGYLALEKWIAGMSEGRKPVDGAFVTFWRILVEQPEVLSWERLWNEGLRDTYRAMYERSRAMAPSTPIGWHLWHVNSFAPFYRAEQDYQAFGPYSDYLKVVMYNNCGGPRLARYVKNVSATLFADLTPEETLQLVYRIQQYPREKALDRIAQEGLSADYVRRETARAVAGAPPGLKIWPGIEIDIPTGPEEKKTQPDDVYQAVKATFEAGAHGIILSRKYSEMRLDNLRAAGRAVRELKLA
jgi:glycosyl hydrolase family 10